MTEVSYDSTIFSKKRRLSSKQKEDFRNYDENDRKETVRNHYKLMRQNQTLSFVKKMHEKYNFKTPRAHYTVKQVFEELKSYVDSSDPDISLPNLIHMLQTAEGIREAGHPDWFQVNQKHFNIITYTC